EHASESPHVTVGNMRQSHRMLYAPESSHVTVGNMRKSHRMLQ
ncbi:4023_t:CDS:1, partial [Rhizophagus irregularis]